MRTTVDLPPLTYQRVKKLAAENHQSLSETVAQLTSRGMEGLLDEEDSTLQYDPLTGLVTFSVGHVVTSAEVADMIDEDMD